MSEAVTQWEIQVPQAANEDAGEAVSRPEKSFTTGACVRIVAA